MRRFWTFLKSHYRAYDFFSDYLRSIKHAGWDVIWAPLLPSVIYWSLWFRPNPPSSWITLIYAVWVVVLAGYFLWRPYHVRLQPQLSIGCIVVQETPINTTGEPRAAFVQIEPICKGDAPIEECRGHLLRVYKRYHGESEWALTEMKERLDLEWSHKGCVPVTLYKSGGQNLNICSHRNDISIILPAVFPLPLRWREVFDSTGSFRFDVEITAKKCAPVSASISVSFDDCNWNEPKVEFL